MKRIMVIGCSGAGKSCFARRLRDLLGLPLFYLDMIWHKADKTNISREEFDAKVTKICDGDEWIIDGNYSRTLELRLKRCDTVFFLDYPLELCLASAAARVGTVREDMPWVEDEFDEEFRQWITDFPQNILPKIYELIESYKGKCAVHIFKSREEADSFLNTIF